MRAYLVYAVIIGAIGWALAGAAVDTMERATAHRAELLADY